MKGMKNPGNTQILVTGGAGYIGSHTIVELDAEGYQPVVIDNLSNSDRSILDGLESILGYPVPFHEMDLCDREAVRDFFRESPNVAGIIHFAAYKAVGESVEKPTDYYRNNLVSLLNLLDEAPEAARQAFVFSSSCTVYGQPERLPVTEKAPIQPAASPYGNTKQICEEILRDTEASGRSLQTIALRYFNPIGAHPSAKIGELPRGVPNNLVPFITQTAIGLRDQLKVFGDDYGTPDGSCIRDYIHIVDLAQAHVVAVKRLLRKKNETPFEVFNLGTGQGYSVFEVIKAFEKVSGEKLNYTVAPRRTGDVEQIYADTTHANKVLGWKATRGIEEMVASAWAWEKAYRKQD